MTTVKSSRRRGRTGSQAEDTALTYVPAEDWTAITVGSTVEVGIPGHHTYVGRVDAKTPDSGIVWVISGSGQGRLMFGHREGVRLQTAGGTT